MQVNTHTLFLLNVPTQLQKNVHKKISAVITTLSTYKMLNESIHFTSANGIM